MARVGTAQGSIVWFTGRSGAGKTTLARRLEAQLPRPVEVFDGDEVRRQLSPELGIGSLARGTAYGEDGFHGHRLNHPVVTNVPYAEFIQ